MSSHANPTAVLTEGRFSGAGGTVTPVSNLPAHLYETPHPEAYTNPHLPSQEARRAIVHQHGAAIADKLRGTAR